MGDRLYWLYSLDSKVRKSHAAEILLRQNHDGGDANGAKHAGGRCSHRRHT